MRDCVDARTRCGNPNYAGFSIFSAWKTELSTRFLVYLFVATSLVDAKFTYLLVNHMGTMVEMNLLIRWLFDLNLLPIWRCIAVLGSFLAATVLGSACILPRGKARMISAVLFSAAISGRIGLNFHMATVYLSLEQATGVFLSISLIAFLVVWKVLHGARSFQDATSLQISSRSSSPQDRKRQLIKAVGALLLIPVGTLVFLQILMNLSGVENLPRWLRSLGVVTELQGKLFLAGFVATILMIAGMIYAVLTLFEVLNGKDELSGLKQIRWG